MSDKELENCPFCGSEAELHIDGDGETTYRMVTCSKKKGCAGREVYVSEKEWNTRSQTKREALLVEALKFIALSENLTWPEITKRPHNCETAKQALAKHKEQ